MIGTDGSASIQSGVFTTALGTAGSDVIEVHTHDSAQLPAAADALLRRLHEAVRAAASVIRQLSPAERGKRGISTEYGEMTVAQAIEEFIVDHAEEHLAQLQTALRR